MSKILTESPTWAPTVTVPTAGDPGDARHSLGEAAWQGLTNRAAYLRGLAEGALQRSGGTVTGNVTVDGDLTVTDDITADDITCQNLTATANVTCSEINAGEGTIGQLGGTSASFNGTVDAGGSITTSQNLRLPGGWRVVYTGSEASRRRIRRLRLASGVSAGPTDQLIFGGSYWLSIASGYKLSVPLPPLSDGTVVEEIRLRCFVSGAGGSIQLIKQYLPTWGGAGVPVAATVGTTTFGTDANVQTVALTLDTPETIDNTTCDYWVRIDGDASANHSLYAAAVVCLMYSPGID